MRMNPLPDDPAVLASLLAAGPPWLEAKRILYGKIEELDALMEEARTRNSPPTPDEAWEWLQRNEEIKALTRKVKFYEPRDQSFWQYVDWPFSWEGSEDPEQVRRNWNSALMAHADAMDEEWAAKAGERAPGGPKGGDAPTHKIFVEAVIGLMNDIRAKLERLSQLDEQTRRQEAAIRAIQAARSPKGIGLLIRALDDLISATEPGSKAKRLEAGIAAGEPWAAQAVFNLWVKINTVSALSPKEVYLEDEDAEDPWYSSIAVPVVMAATVIRGLYERWKVPKVGDRKVFPEGDKYRVEGFPGLHPIHPPTVSQDEHERLVEARDALERAMYELARDTVAKGDSQHEPSPTSAATEAVEDGRIYCTGPDLSKAYLLGNDNKLVLADRARRAGDIKDFRMEDGSLYVIPANDEKRERLLQVQEAKKENRRRNGK